jgi:membrane fusion protein (multidrug efflux system)
MEQNISSIKIPKAVIFYVIMLSIVSMFFFSCGNNQSDAGAVAETPAYPVFAVKAQTATLKTNYPASLQGEQNIEIRP